MSTARCGTVYCDVVDTTNLSGSFFAIASTSASVLAGESTLTAAIIGLMPTIATGTKSLTISTIWLLNMYGVSTYADAGANTNA